MDYTYWNACEYSLGQSPIDAIIYRMWMKSNVPGAKVQSSSASSNSNLQFGGMNRGIVFDKSVPMTSAEGNWSAKSLYFVRFFESC